MMSTDKKRVQFLAPNRLIYSTDTLAACWTKIERTYS